MYMKSVLRFVLCMLFVVCLVSFVGCAKKSEPQPAAPAAPAQKPAPSSTPVAAPKPTTAAPAAPVVPAAKTPETPAPAVPAQPVASKLTSEALAAVPMDQVKAEAGKLNLEQLKTKAADYKNAILAKKEELTKETAKLKEIPVTQMLSTDATTLQTNIANLTKMVSGLTEKFQVYNDKIKELGGTALSLTQ
jgi:hypothetical protein